MTDIVIRALSRKEAYELRMLKLRLEERNWRTLILRLVRERESTHFGCERKQERITTVIK